MLRGRRRSDMIAAIVSSAPKLVGNRRTSALILQSMSELSAANDSTAFPQTPLPSSSQLFSSRDFRQTPSEEIMSVVTQDSEPLHKACDTCRARKTRCSESRFQSVGRELPPGRCLTNLVFTPEISGNTDACDFCLVYQAAMSRLSEC